MLSVYYVSNTRGVYADDAFSFYTSVTRVKENSRS
jgi:hypothetical protein